MMKDRRDVAMLLVRIGLGLVFLYFGIGKFRGDAWVDTMASMPLLTRLPWPMSVNVASAGTLEILTGLCLCGGFLVRAAALLACAELIAILFLLSTIGIFEARDVGLLAASAAVVLSTVAFFGKRA